MIWLLLAVALPLGFVALLFQARDPLLQDPPDQPPVPALPVILDSATTPDMVLTLRQSAQPTDGQLTIQLNRPLTVPSAVVCVQQRGRWQAIGLLNAPGLYRFRVRVTDRHPQLLIVDNLHRKTLQTITLRPDSTRITHSTY